MKREREREEEGHGNSRAQRERREKRGERTRENQQERREEEKVWPECRRRLLPVLLAVSDIRCHSLRPSPLIGRSMGGEQPDRLCSSRFRLCVSEDPFMTEMPLNRGLGSRHDKMQMQMHCWHRGGRRDEKSRCTLPP